LDGGRVKDGGSQASVWWKHLHDGMVIVVGNRENVFWQNLWLEGGPMYNTLRIFFELSETYYVLIRVVR
jgi:hypothetical protein